MKKAPIGKYLYKQNVKLYHKKHKNEKVWNATENAVYKTQQEIDEYYKDILPLNILSEVIAKLENKKKPIWDILLSVMNGIVTGLAASSVFYIMVEYFDLIKKLNLTDNVLAKIIFIIFVVVIILVFVLIISLYNIVIAKSKPNGYHLYILPYEKTKAIESLRKFYSIDFHL